MIGSDCKYFQVFCRDSAGSLALIFFFREAWIISDINVGSLFYFKCASARMAADSRVGVSQTFPLALEVVFTAKVKEAQQIADEWPCVLPLTQPLGSNHTEGIWVWVFKTSALGGVLHHGALCSLFDDVMSNLEIAVGELWLLLSEFCSIGVYSRLQQTSWFMKNLNVPLNVCKASGSPFFNTKSGKLSLAPHRNCSLMRRKTGGGGRRVKMRQQRQKVSFRSQWQMTGSDLTIEESRQLSIINVRVRLKYFTRTNLIALLSRCPTLTSSNRTRDDNPAGAWVCSCWASWGLLCSCLARTSQHSQKNKSQTKDCQAVPVLSQGFVQITWGLPSIEGVSVEPAHVSFQGP